MALINVKNSGQTPAFNVNYIGAIAFFPPEANFEFPKIPPSLGIIGPGMESNKFNRYFALSASERKFFEEGTKAIYIFGRITYDDAFGKSKFTNYRYMVGGAFGTRGPDVAQCEEGNDAN
ncbi:MAG: hypothetical protein M3436_10800 [Pseudomonadota bacterium]|nr:hypothetical protein [Pseudomonadota bacterium]